LKHFEISIPNTLDMKDLHSWKVNVQEAIQIQEALRDRIILENTFKDVTKIGGADVGYSKDKTFLYAVIVVLSFPEMAMIENAAAHGKTPFPYIPGLFSFREGPTLIEAFRKLNLRPDVMIFEGQGIAHPRGFGLASHLGLWLDLPSIGCTKTPLLRDFIYPGPSKGSYEVMRREREEVGAVLRTKENVKPVFISPGHGIDLETSMKIVLTTCTKFRIPEPLRKAHQFSRLPREKSFFP
jgi:deoxyribonuclease V